ncbi:MAG: MBL fold metallo-hydrolase [Candidatus Micrarchaeota archaeon]
MELVFLGNGGGRIVLDRQALPTGGFRVNSPSLNIHVDPGPGAFLKSFQHGQDPKELDSLFCSHAHIDHCHDANILIEAMNSGNYSGKKGVLLGSESVVNGFQKFEKQIDEYFKGMLQECRAMEASEMHIFGKPGGADKSGNSPTPKASLKATRTLHEDQSDIGFVLEIGGIRLGYTSDTGFFPGIASEYDACDFLIINCLRPNDDRLEFHLTSMEAVKIIGEIKKKPRAVILTHIGMKFINAGMDSQRKLVEEESGVQTILAREGLKLDLARLKKQSALQ